MIFVSSECALFFFRRSGTGASDVTDGSKEVAMMERENRLRRVWPGPHKNNQ